MTATLHKGTALNFSALGSVYSREKAEYLDSALASLHHQALRANEIVLVHDGPLNEKLYRCLDKWQRILPLKQVLLEKNLGLGAALNAGLKECSHDLVARFDTDDINRPQRFEVQLDFLSKNPETDILFSDLSAFRRVPNDLGRIRRISCDLKEMVGHLESENYLTHPSVIFKKKSVLLSGGYPIDIPWIEDYGLWLKMIYEGYKFNNICQVLVDYRVGTKQILRKTSISYVKSEIKIYKI